MITLFIVSFLTPISSPGISFAPGFHWLTMETAHFSIHFPCQGPLTEERLDFIRRVAETAIELRQTLTENGVQVPETKVHIVVADYHDYYNGYAAPFPDNTIVIMPFPPGPDKASSEDWLRSLLLHEYSHIVQLDQCQGFPLILRRIFGRVILPNALVPLWFIEGYAVYNESRFSGFGRQRSAEWRSILLTAAQNRRLLPLDRCGNYELKRYPSSLAPYLYGSGFFSFLTQRNGATIWEAFNHQISRQVPLISTLTLTSTFSRVFGTSLASLYQDWQTLLIRQADSQLSTITQKLVLRQITFEGFSTSSPIWSPNGRDIYYISASGRERRAIKALNLGEGTPRTIHQGEVFGALSLSPDARFLAFAELLVKGQGYTQSDIFFYDLFQGKLKRVTFNERARDPDFAPNRPAIVYVRNDSAKSRLVILDYQTGEKTVLAEMSGLDYFHQPRFSPEGGLIAVGVWREPGNADIELIDLKNGWVIPITQDPACDLFPCWSRTGKVLFFVSDRSGIYNLYAYAIEAQRLYRCTDVLEGVFEPAVAPDNKKIAVNALGPDGYDINLIEFHPEKWQLVEEVIDNYPQMEVTAKSGEMPAAVYHYNPMPTVMPKFWLPWITFDSVVGLGVMTMGWDVLRFHQYQAAVVYKHKEKTPQLDFSYELHRYRPVLSLDLCLNLNLFKSRATVELPIYQTGHYQSLGMGALLSRDAALSLLFDGFYRFSNARKFRFCVAPVQGRNFGVVATAESKRLLSPHNRLRAILYWKEYFGNPPAVWSLSPRLAMGTSYGDSSRFSAFALTSQEGLFRVRGYPDLSGTGANILAGGLEFRTPFCWVERGLGTVPIFLSNINGALFSDAGLTLDDMSRGIKHWRIGVGAEMGFDFILVHYVPLRFSAGFALGLKKPLTHQFYLQVKSEILEGILNKPFNPLRFNLE